MRAARTAALSKVSRLSLLSIDLCVVGVMRRSIALLVAALVGCPLLAGWLVATAIASRPDVVRDGAARVQRRMGRCRVPPGYHRAHTFPTMLVFKRVFRRPYIRFGYRACLQSTGQQRMVVTVNQDGHLAEGVTGFAPRGDWLVTSTVIDEPGLGACGGHLYAIDLRTGAKARLAYGLPIGACRVIADIPNDPNPWDASGTIPFRANGKPPVLIVVTSNGIIAWVVLGYSKNRSVQKDGLFISTGDNSPKLLDEGPPGSITELTSNGDAIAWLNGGVVHSARLS
jgi:hypothetical protein